MSSIVTKEGQKKPYNKAVVTANVAQNNNKVHKVTEKKIQKIFLICESCFWCASSCDLYYDYDNVLRSQDIITTQYASCPACRTDKGVESLPILLDKSDKHFTGVNYY
ncbi:MAG: hypothetical protein WA941_12445 [Nitrososphaeraceae archaeon]